MTTSSAVNPLQVGQQAPEFSLRSQNGEHLALADYRGKKAVVLVFYPWAFSQVCQGELCALRDDLPRFDNDDVALIGISCDAMFSQRAFADAERIAFPLLSDHWPHGGTAKAYGVFNETTGASDRSTFIIGKDGVIAWAVHNDIPAARDLEAYAAALTAL